MQPVTQVTELAALPFSSLSLQTSTYSGRVSKMPASSTLALLHQVLCRGHGFEISRRHGGQFLVELSAQLDEANIFFLTFLCTQLQVPDWRVAALQSTDGLLRNYGLLGRSKAKLHRLPFLRLLQKQLHLSLACKKHFRRLYDHRRHAETVALLGSATTKRLLSPCPQRTCSCYLVWASSAWTLCRMPTGCPLP